jgi:hypothetical protein
MPNVVDATGRSNKTVNQAKRECTRIGSVCVFHDPWSRKNAMIKYAAKCAVCKRKVYQLSEDGSHWYDPDPRGSLSEKHAAYSLVADEDDKQGDDLLLCYECGNTRETSEAGYKLARAQWIDPQETQTLATLKALPTIDQGHFDDLKVQTSIYRLWLSRMTKEDGAEHNNGVTLDKLIDGVWTTINEYEAR